MTTSFGAKLKEYRTNLNPKLSQQAFAEELKYGSRNSVGDWERNKTVPPRETILKMRAVLRLDLDELNELLLLAGFGPEPDGRDDVEVTTQQKRDIAQAVEKGFEKQADQLPKKVAEELEPLLQKESRPTIKLIDNYSQHLPAHGLIGREDEIDWVIDELEKGGQAAIVGVRGIGGIGKTALAATVAKQLAQTYPGGVLWVTCGPNSVANVQELMALHIGQQLEGEGLSQRAAQLQLGMGKHPAMLLVLDDVRLHHKQNFEHLRPPAPHALLLTSRRTDVLQSSRQQKTLNELNDDAAKALLAQEMGGRWLDEAEDEQVKAILELLENVPLALILAGRWLNGKLNRKNPPEQPVHYLLDNLLKQRAALLDQDSSKQNLSLRVTFNLSYEELNEAAQRRVRQLGMFASNRFLEVGIAILWQMEDEEERRQAIQQLENSGIIQEYDDNVYWMHDVLRQYARQKLQKNKEDWKIARQSHAYFCERVLDQIKLTNVQSWEALFGFMPEILLAARWLEEAWQNEPQLAVNLAFELSRTMYSRVDIPLTSWIQTGIKAAEKATLEREKAVLQSSLADLLMQRGRYDEAEGLYNESLQVKKKIGDARGVAVTQSSLADLLKNRGRYEEAEGLYNESLQVFKQIGDARGVAVTQSSLADLLMQRGRYDEAEGLYNESLQFSKKIGDARGVAVTQSALADLLKNRGRYDEAEGLYNESLQVKKKIGDARGVAVTQSSLADLLKNRGRYDEAEGLYNESLQVFKQIGDARGVAVTQSSLADLLMQRGRYDEAEGLYNESLQFSKKIGDARGVAVTQSALADLLKNRGRYDEAEGLYNESLQVKKKIGDARGVAVTQVGLADIFVRRGKVQEAADLYQQAMQQFDQISDTFSLAATMTRFAQLLLAVNQKKDAIVYLQQAKAIFTKLQASQWQEGVEQLLTQAGQADGITLEQIIGLVKQAIAGDREAGQQIWEFAENMMAQTEHRELGYALQKLLLKEPPEKALVTLPQELRDEIIRLLNSE